MLMWMLACRSESFQRVGRVKTSSSGRITSFFRAWASLGLAVRGATESLSSTSLFTAELDVLSGERAPPRRYAGEYADRRGRGALDEALEVGFAAERDEEMVEEPLSDEEPDVWMLWKMSCLKRCLKAVCSRYGGREKNAVGGADIEGMPKVMSAFAAASAAPGNEDGEGVPGVTTFPRLCPADPHAEVVLLVAR